MNQDQLRTYVKMECLDIEGFLLVEMDFDKFSAAADLLDPYFTPITVYRDLGALPFWMYQVRPYEVVVMAMICPALVCDLPDMTIMMLVRRLKTRWDTEFSLWDTDPECYPVPGNLVEEMIDGIG